MCYSLNLSATEPVSTRTKQNWQNSNPVISLPISWTREQARNQLYSSILLALTLSLSNQRLLALMRRFATLRIHKSSYQGRPPSLQSSSSAMLNLSHLQREQDRSAILSTTTWKEAQTNQLYLLGLQISVPEMTSMQMLKLPGISQPLPLKLRAQAQLAR